MRVGSRSAQSQAKLGPFGAKILSLLPIALFLEVATSRSLVSQYKSDTQSIILGDFEHMTRLHSRRETTRLDCL